MTLRSIPIQSDRLPPIPVTPDPTDFTSRAVWAELKISILRAELIAAVMEVEQHDNTNTVRDAELVRSIDAHLSDLAGDVGGTFNKVAQNLIDDRYGGCARGPFYRTRR